ncbi:interactor of HORMAD1 protein 1 isoform X1 [Gouania willdenowi]|nr:uncharacterized protein LOC114463732 isoform X1 [Gouania willdenowi]
MMSHLRNLKDILNIPTGSRNDPAGGNSMLTDSQIFFGSQFWNENSMGASQDLSLSSRNSQFSSEGSDPTLSTLYKNKPPLFGDKTKSFGILEKFEEDRRKTKEKSECGIFVKECHLIKESIQTLTADTGKNTNVCHSILEKMDNFSATLQNNLISFQSVTSQQFDTLVTKMNGQQQSISELEDRVRKSGCSTAEIDSQMQSLKKSVEGLREEQDNERHMLKEALKHLNTLVTVYSVKMDTQRVVDKTSQTSPVLQWPVLNIIQENNLRDTQLEQKQVEAPPLGQNHIRGKTKPTRERLRKRRSAVSRRSKCTVSDENSPPFISNYIQGGSRTHSEDTVVPLRKTSENGGCFLSPYCVFSQESNSPEGLLKVTPVIERLSSPSNKGTAVPPLGLWQLFEM